MDSVTGFDKPRGLLRKPAQAPRLLSSSVKKKKGGGAYSDVRGEKQRDAPMTAPNEPGPPGCGQSGAAVACAGTQRFRGAVQQALEQPDAAGRGQGARQGRPPHFAAAPSPGEPSRACGTGRRSGGVGVSVGASPGDQSPALPPPVARARGGQSGAGGGEGLNFLLMDGRDKFPRRSPSPAPPPRGRLASLARLLRPLRGRSGRERSAPPARRESRRSGAPRAPPGLPASPAWMRRGLHLPAGNCGRRSPGRPLPSLRGPALWRLTCRRRWPSWSRCWRRRRPPGRSSGSGSRPARSTRRCARRS